MDIAKTYFALKAFDEDKLTEFGFVKGDGKFIYNAPIMDGQFKLEIQIEGGAAESEVFEADTGERFVLYSVEGANGSFVGQMRAEAEAIFGRIAKECCHDEIFKGEQTKRVIEYARTKYGTEVEYLWEKFPRNGVLRRKDNKKWYAAILSVEGKKIGLDCEGIVEVIDLRGDECEIKTGIEEERFLPAYHMNKVHWFTVVLDADCTDKQLFTLIDESYMIAEKGEKEINNRARRANLRGAL